MPVKPVQAGTTTRKFLARVSSCVPCLVIGLLSMLLGTAPVNAQTQLPQINDPMVPTVASPGGAAFNLTLNGTGFVSGSVVNWNKSPRTTTFGSATQLTASITAADIATASTAAITVTNPSGATSNVVFFLVTKSAAVSLSRTDLSANGSPTASVVGDFDGDGKLDVVVADGTSNMILFFKGNGDGTFQPPVSSAVEGFPVLIVAGDFNNDGKLDIATVDQHLDDVSVLLGNGDGTFSAHQEFPTGSNPQWLATGDFNGDGNLDIVTANFNDNTVSILTGTGSGTFNTHSDFATGNHPQSVAVGDFNGDGKLDLAVANNADSTVSILLGNGDGTFGAHTDFATAKIPNSVIAADFSGDGKLDLAVGTATSQASILLGNGDGTFAAHKDFATGSFPFALRAADLNGDGKVDLVLPSFNDNTVSVLLGNGNGTFATHSDYPVGVSPNCVSVGDFNNDGRLDLIASNEADSTISVMLQTAVAYSPQSTLFGTVTAGTSSTPKTVTLKNSGSGTFTIGSIALTGPQAADYLQTNTCGGSLAPNASCAFTVTFMPQGAFNRRAAITVTETGGSTLSATLLGTGNVKISLNPRIINFGTLPLGTKSATRTVTFQNTSLVNIPINSITITGANFQDFAQTNNCPISPATLAPSASCTINLTFTPTEDGGELANVVVQGGFSAGNGFQASQLEGKGSSVSLSPTSLTFAGQKVGTTSNPKTVTLTNIGTSTLTFTGTGISIIGTNPGDFAQTNTCGASVAPGANCAISVTFTPTATGSRTATLNIADSDPTGPQTVKLSGTGK